MLGLTNMYLFVACITCEADNDPFIRLYSTMYVPWSDFQVTSFGIPVDSRIRLALIVTSYSYLKLPVYFGPTEKLPFTMKSNGTGISQKGLVSMH